MRDSRPWHIASLDADQVGALDAVHDGANRPLDQEPQQMREVLLALAEGSRR